MSELAAVSVTALKGVGTALAEKLAKVGLENLQDVLFHLPFRGDESAKFFQNFRSGAKDLGILLLRRPPVGAGF